MLIPAMPGTSTSSCSWSPAKIAPKRARKSSGRTKLKNAALGLRQNIRRSRRYWRHASSTMRGLLRRLGRGVELDVLPRRAGHGEVADALAAGQGRRGQLVQQPGGVLGLAADQLSGGLAPRDAVQR